MSRGDLTVALKLQADVADAVKRLHDVEGALDRVAAAGAGSGAAPRVDALAQAARAASTAHQQLATAASQSGAVSAAAAQRLRDVGISAGQTAQAMRQLPMQITDITTSLASGMPVWMVAIQQGGQIRDSFGGIGPALRAIASMLRPVTVGVGAVAVGIGALALAYMQAEKETTAFNLALASTGNAAGVTRGQLETMSAEAARVSGISVGAARDIAIAMVQTGQLGADTIGALTKSVQTYAAITGQSTRDAGAALASMFAKPSDAAAQLNRQFNFLSIEQMRYIRQLEEQGRAEEAQLVLAQRLEERLGSLALGSMGTLERMWHAVGNAAATAWDRMRDIGRPETLDDKVARATAEVERLRAAAARPPRIGEGGLLANNRPGDLQRAEANLAAAQAAQQAEREAAAEARAAAVRRKAQEDADKSWKHREDSLRTWREKLKDETEKIRREGATLGKTEAEIDQQIARAAEKLAPKGGARRTRTSDPVATAYQSQLQSLTLARAEAEQRLQNAKEGVSGADERATTRLEAWLGVNRNALRLNDQQVESLRRLAKETDAASKATTQLAEAKARGERITAGMADVEARAQQISGNAAEAAIAAVQERWRKLRADLVAAGDEAGLARLDKVMGLEEASAKLAELERQVRRLFDAQGRGEQSIDVQVQSGLITELEARKRIVELNRDTADQVDALIPRMRELAAITGNPDMAAGIEQVAIETKKLRVSADDLGKKFMDSFESGFGQMLEDLATGTATLEEAMLGMLRNIASEMASFAARQLAQEAAAGIMGLFGGGGAGEEASSVVSGIQAVTAAQTAADAARAASAVTATTTVAAAQAPAAAATTAAWSPAATVASIGSFGSAAAIGIAAVLAALALAKGFATGGYTGDGTKYQPAGIVHAGEYVTRQEVTGQPGARAFLDDFNERGMAAIYGWRGYADGGFVTAAPVTAPRMAAPPVADAPAASAGAEQGGRFRIVNVIDPSLYADYAESPAGEKVLMNVIRRNAGAVRQVLG